MIRAIAALALLSATAAVAAPAVQSTDTLSSTAPWWEKVTVTIAGDGKPQSCRFESSLKPNSSQSCEVTGSQAAMGGGSGSKGEYTRITFERRFKPGAQPDAGDVQPGDTLLGRQVMALAIDGAGSVKHCKIVASSGAMTPDYGCEEASAERFEAKATKASAVLTEASMTILVYGHSEYMV